MKEKIIRMIHIVSACIPLLLIGLLIAHRILTGGGITAEELLTYTPESPIMAALVMILFFLCKSLSIFFPVTVLCIASGLLFPLPAALLVVTIGLGLGTVVMYWMGCWQGRASVDKLLARYPKAQHLQDIQSSNVFFFTFTLRIMGLLPCDVVSLYMGATGADFWPYLGGGMLGFLPLIVLEVCIGQSIHTPGSPQFLLALGLRLALSLGSLLVYWRKFHKAAR